MVTGSAQVKEMTYLGGFDSSCPFGGNAPKSNLPVVGADNQLIDTVVYTQST